MLEGCKEGQEKLAALLSTVTEIREEIKEKTPGWIKHCDTWME